MVNMKEKVKMIRERYKDHDNMALFTLPVTPEITNVVVRWRRENGGKLTEDDLKKYTDKHFKKLNPELAFLQARFAVDISYASVGGTDLDKSLDEKIQYIIDNCTKEVN